MKNLLEEHRIKREKAIAEHKQNELLRLKQEKQAWFNNYRANMASWHENYEPDLDTCIDRLWWQNFCISPQELINNEINAIQAIKRSWGGVVMPAYYFSPIQFEYTQQAKNLEAEKAGIHQILRNEFIDILHKLYPNWYPVNFKDWPADSWGKRDVIDKGDYETIQANLPTYRRQLAEKLEAERLEAARIKEEQLKAQKLEEERLEAQRLELQRLKTERIKGEQLKAQKLEEERLQAEKLELERLEAEQVYKQQLLTKELIEILPKLYPNYYPVNFENWPDDWGKTVINGRNFEAIEQQLPTYRRQLAEKLEADRLEATRIKVEQLKAQKLEEERLQAEKLKAQKLEAERLEAQRLELQRLETERIKAEQLKAQKLEEERLQAEKLELERLELERIKTEQLEIERLEAERLQAEKLEAELGIGVSNNHDFVEVQLQSSFYDEYFQWSAEYQYDPSMFLK